MGTLREIVGACDAADYDDDNHDADYDFGDYSTRKI